jgi:alpha-glucoside transport system substrate-binding protein
VLTDFLVRIGNRGSELVPDAVDDALAELKQVEG